MTRFALTTIVLATLYATAYAQTACEKSVKVLNQGDLDAIRGCKIFKGAIEVSESNLATLRLDGVEELIGDLVLTRNADLQTFLAPDLKKVDGVVRIENHTILNKVDLPKLTEVKGMSMAVLPALEVINFPAGLSKVSTLRIEDTRAPSVDGFMAETLDSFYLLNNNFIRSFDFNSVREITGELLILGNNKAFSFEAKNLGSVRTATFFNLGSIDMPALGSVKADISFHDNEFTKLSLNAIEIIDGTLAIANNNQLVETSFNNLIRINGALSIGNNTELSAIDGFPALSEIHGTLDLAGAFNSYSLPALQDVRGGMRLQTTSTKLGCSDIERKLKGENVVKGNTWSCSANMQESNMIPTVGQNPTSPKSGSKTEETSSGGSGQGSSGSTNMEAASSATKAIAQGSTWFAAAIGLIYALGH